MTGSENRFNQLSRIGQRRLVHQFVAMLGNQFNGVCCIIGRKKMVKRFFDPTVLRKPAPRCGMKFYDLIRFKATGLIPVVEILERGGGSGTIRAGRRGG